MIQIVVRTGTVASRPVITAVQGIPPGEKARSRASQPIVRASNGIARTLATPGPIKDWSLTSLKEKLIKIGAKIVSHGRYVAFQMAEVAIPRNLFADILRLIAELRPAPDAAPA